MTGDAYCGRFAPTPSGPLHFGSLVAAAGSYLEARSRGGLWRLRIDDLDPLRVAPGATGAILRCLEALGFEWDGPIVYQSKRLAAYHASLHRLRTMGVVYPCSCSRREIAETGLRGREGSIYPGTCRARTCARRPARALRLNVSGATVEFDDRLLGLQQRQLADTLGDFIVYRADGVYAFHLASAVDDGEHAITDVVRGADLLESSARQIHVLDLLDLPVPRYTHLPVAVDAAGHKLSKQTHASALDASRPASALCATLRFLNQPVAPGLDRAALSEVWAHALRHWDLARVGRRPQAQVAQ